MEHSGDLPVPIPGVTHPACESSQLRREIMGVRTLPALLEPYPQHLAQCGAQEELDTFLLHV